MMDAAQIMMDGVVFASHTDRCKATDRLVRLRADYSLPTMGLVTYLTDDEEMALRGVASADSPQTLGQTVALQAPPIRKRSSSRKLDWRPLTCCRLAVCELNHLISVIPC